MGGTVALVAGGGIQPVVTETTLNGTVTGLTQIKFPVLPRLMVAIFFPV